MELKGYKGLADMEFVHSKQVSFLRVPTEMTADELYNSLCKRVVRFCFRKQNGNLRVAWGTLNHELIDLFMDHEDDASADTSNRKDINESVHHEESPILVNARRMGMMRFFDLEKKAMRGFRMTPKDGDMSNSGRLLACELTPNGRVMGSSWVEFVIEGGVWYNILQAESDEDQVKRYRAYVTPAGRLRPQVRNQLPEFKDEYTKFVIGRNDAVKMEKKLAKRFVQQDVLDRLAKQEQFTSEKAVLLPVFQAIKAEQKAHRNDVITLSKERLQDIEDAFAVGAAHPIGGAVFNRLKTDTFFVDKSDTDEASDSLMAGTVYFICTKSICFSVYVLQHVSDEGKVIYFGFYEIYYKVTANARKILDSVKKNYSVLNKMIYDQKDLQYTKNALMRYRQVGAKMATLLAEDYKQQKGSDRPVSQATFDDMYKRNLNLIAYCILNHQKHSHNVVKGKMITFKMALDKAGKYHLTIINNMVYLVVNGGESAKSVLIAKRRLEQPVSDFIQTIGKGLAQGMRKASNYKMPKEDVAKTAKGVMLILTAGYNLRRNYVKKMQEQLNAK